MKQVLISAIVSIIILGLGYMYLQEHPGSLGASTSAAQESTYDRVMRTGEIHCGYSVWDPLFYIDTKDGEKKGIFHDLMEEVGKRLDLKIIWQEELGWGNVVESIKTGRVDMSCAGYWLNPERIKHVLSTVPQIYSPLYVWVRADDTRFKTLDDLNSDQVNAGTIDGSADGHVIMQRFPKAKILSMPEMSTSSDVIQNLVTGKVDFILIDDMTLASYLANNPGKIRNAFPDRPLVLFPAVMLLPPTDMHFKNVIDNALHNIEYDGTLDAILKTYHTEHSFLRNPPPVKTP